MLGKKSLSPISSVLILTNCTCSCRFSFFFLKIVKALKSANIQLKLQAYHVKGGVRDL
jgi:hypothetical protein